jgi:hypothetical protein
MTANHAAAVAPAGGDHDLGPDAAELAAAACCHPLDALPGHGGGQRMGEFFGH